MFPGVYTASLMAGEKSGNLEQVIRRYVAYVKVVEGVRRKVISALIYPAVLLTLSVVVVGILVLRVVPQFSGYYEQFGQELPLSTRVIVAISSYATAYFRLDGHRGRGGRGGDLVLAQTARRARTARSLDPADAAARLGGEEVRDLAGVADAGDAARRRDSARQRDRCGGALDQEPLHGAGTAQGVAAGARGPGARGGDDRQRRVSRTWR